MGKPIHEQMLEEMQKKYAHESMHTASELAIDVITNMLSALYAYIELTDNEFSTNYQSDVFLTALKTKSEEYRKAMQERVTDLFDQKLKEKS